MELTKKQAIEKTIELWIWLAETGKRKEGWQGWKKYGGLDELGDCEEVVSLCFLCEFTGEEDVDCEGCPYARKFGDCTNREAPYHEWVGARTTRTQKKYAGLFLEQLRQL